MSSPTGSAALAVLISGPLVLGMLALTFGPAYLAQRRQSSAVPAWLITAILLGPLTGVVYGVLRWRERERQSHPAV